MAGISERLAQEVVPKGQPSSRPAAFCEPPAFRKALLRFWERGQACALGSSGFNPANEARGAPLSLPVPVGMGEVRARLPTDPLSEDGTFTSEGSRFTEGLSRV